MAARAKNKTFLAKQFVIGLARALCDKKLTIIHWIVIYPVDGVIQLLHNWGQ